MTDISYALQKGKVLMWINQSKYLVKRYFKVIRRRLYPLSRETVLSALRGLGEPPANYVNVHSSLSRCGQIIGGSPSVLAALRNWVCGRNLVIPTHTYCYPDSNGDTPIFDPQVTASVVGQVTDHFWRLPDSVRSLHPTHSLAAIGPDAESICANHESCDTPCGRGTPYERLIEQDCSTLMFGVTMNVYTFFHTAEDAAGLPFLYEEQPYALKYKDQDGGVCTLKTRRQNMRIARRFVEMDRWLEQRGMLIRRKLGLGELLFLPSAAKVHCAVVEELKREPLFLVDESARPALLQQYKIKT